MPRRLQYILFFIFFFIKLAISYEYARHLFCVAPEVKSGKMTSFNGDSFSYTGAMENYITKGEYYFEFNEKKIDAGRVPHYSVPYYLLRQVFDRETSLDIFITLQILLESFAFFLVSVILLDITRSKLIFGLSLLFSSGSYFYTHYSLIPITDSPASALLLISFWFLYCYFKAEKPKFLNWVLFIIIISIVSILRPYVGLICAMVCGYFFIRNKFSIVSTIKHAVLYPVVLLVLLAPWIIRNYNKSGRIIFFQQDMYAGYVVSDELKLTRKMLAAIGEDASTMWDKTTAAGYFSQSTYKKSEWKVPAEITTDSVLNINFMAIRNLSIDTINDETQSALFKLHYSAFMDRYKNQHGARYYFLNYISKIKRFLFHSGSYYYSYNQNDGCSTRIHFYLKVLQSLFYFLCLIFGFIGLVILARQISYTIIFLIPTICLLLIFPVFLGLIEWRYFLPFYFFHQIGLFYLLFRILKFFKLIS